MKRKKWSELEEQTLLAKYSELLKSGGLLKLKTREKKFRPIAEHVNSVHHLRDPVSFPFKWSWRDVSIKVQNMRHQYLGVKQKIKISNDEYNWNDGENHWENFLKYKEVFGDVELEVKTKKPSDSTACDLFKDYEDMGLGIDSEDLDEEEREDGEEKEGNNINDDNVNAAEGEENEFVAEKVNGELGVSRKANTKKNFGATKRLGLLGAQVMDLRDILVTREEKRREREVSREIHALESEENKRELEYRRETRMNKTEDRLENWELELEEREFTWARRESERRKRVERELDEERKRRRILEEEREEREMEWNERMLGMQIEHEKAMMQIQLDAYQSQMQILGLMTRLVCQFYGSSNDGLNGGLGVLPSQVLQNLQHTGDGLTDNDKPDENSPSEFM